MLLKLSPQTQAARFFSSAAGRNTYRRSPWSNCHGGQQFCPRASNNTHHQFRRKKIKMDLPKPNGWTFCLCLSANHHHTIHKQVDNVMALLRQPLFISKCSSPSMVHSIKGTIVSKESNEFLKKHHMLHFIKTSGTRHKGRSRRHKATKRFIALAESIRNGGLKVIQTTKGFQFGQTGPGKIAHPRLFLFFCPKFDYIEI